MSVYIVQWFDEDDLPRAWATGDELDAVVTHSVVQLEAYLSTGKASVAGKRMSDFTVCISMMEGEAAEA